MNVILIIEDNEGIRSNTAELLELSNYKVIAANDGQEGLQLAINHRPDLILCDILMPGLDGYAVLTAVRKSDHLKNTPFIFLSAKTELSDFRKGMELGADDYLPKPFDATELLTAIDRRIRKAESINQDFPPHFGKEDASFMENSSLESLMAGMDTNRYTKKQLIYQEGNHPTRLYYLLAGKVKAFRTNDDGKELVTELYATGDFLGHVAFLEGTTYRDTAEAITDAEVAIIPHEEFEQLLNQDQDLARRFIRNLSKNVTAIEEHLVGIAYNSLRRKVAYAILLYSKKYGEKRKDRFVIDISRESLATIAGTATESLIRTLGDFRAENIISIEDGLIYISDEQKLERMVENLKI